MQKNTQNGERKWAAKRGVCANALCPRCNCLPQNSPALSRVRPVCCWLRVWLWAYQPNGEALQQQHQSRALMVNWSP